VAASVVVRTVLEVSRSLLARTFVASTVFVAAAVIFFSQSVANAWGDLASPDHFAEGSLAFRFLEWRASLQEADVHLAIWLVAGLVSVTFVSSRRIATRSAVVLVVAAVAIELLQPVYSSRNGQLGDAIGGILGVALAALLRGALALRRAMARRAQRVRPAHPRTSGVAVEWSS
jgi:hypothetical protein